MGPGNWIAKKGATGIIKAIIHHYNQGIAMYKTQGLTDMPSLCRDVIENRYQAIPAKPSELAVIQSGIEDVEDIFDAVFLAILAEGKVDSRIDPALYALYAKTVAEETPKRAADNTSAKTSSNTSCMKNRLMEKFITYAILQPFNPTFAIRGEKNFFLA